jgi:nucleoside-diphosphate-sugar epimerase
MDLREDCVGKAAEILHDVSHVIYAARADFDGISGDSVQENTSMLEKVLDAVAQWGHRVTHIHLVHGSRYYGQHRGPYKVPASEDDEPVWRGHFYHQQQRLLAERHRYASWSWSVSRPNFICDDRRVRRRSVPCVIAAYALLARLSGERLDFPGDVGCWNASFELTSGNLLGQAVVAIASKCETGGRAFNVTNGDSLKWADIWSHVANVCNVMVGAVAPRALGEWAMQRRSVWEDFVRDKPWLPASVSELAPWGFAQMVWSQDYDSLSSICALRGLGVNPSEQTSIMLLRQIAAAMRQLEG